MHPQHTRHLPQKAVREAKLQTMNRLRLLEEMRELGPIASKDLGYLDILTIVRLR